MGSEWTDGADSRLSRRRAVTLGGGAVAAALTTVGFPDRRQPSRSSVAESGSFTAVHSLGITGEGVRVGVLDPTGFDADHPDLADRVRALRGFDGAPVVGSVGSHGTEAAATVGRVAPDASQFLATFERATGFERALEWFDEVGADVVLTPVAAHGVAAVGGGEVTDAASAAAEAGITVVAPTGNAARGHWQGPLGAIASDGGSSTLLGVESPASDEPPAGSLDVWAGCRADDPPELSLALLRRTPTGDGRQLIALSRTERPGLERLTADLEPGPYALELRLPNRSGVPDALAPATVAITTPTHRLSPARPAGSVAAPASARGVVAVGALGESRVAPYSGRGPTPDRSPGVDLVADPGSWATIADPGTSGAAARVAGVAALAAATRQSGEAEPSVADALRETATPIEGANAATFAAGHGVVDPLAAVRRRRGD